MSEIVFPSSSWLVNVCSSIRLAVINCFEDSAPKTWLCRLLSAYFLKVGLWDSSAVCVSDCFYVCLWIPLLTFMPESVCMRTGMYSYTMALELTSTTYFINHSHQILCLHVQLSLVGRQRQCKCSYFSRQQIRWKHYRGNLCRRNNRTIVERLVFTKDTEWFVSSQILVSSLFFPLFKSICLCMYVI
jgi:hypothetical protein